MSQVPSWPMGLLLFMASMGSGYLTALGANYALAELKRRKRLKELMGAHPTLKNEPMSIIPGKIGYIRRTNDE